MQAILDTPVIPQRPAIHPRPGTFATNEVTKLIAGFPVNGTFAVTPTKIVQLRRFPTAAARGKPRRICRYGSIDPIKDPPIVWARLSA